jgi:hypothetical protein
MMKAKALILTTMLLAATAQAHEGHGLEGAHWHATDVFGFIAALAVVGGLVWWRGRK